MLSFIQILCYCNANCLSSSWASCTVCQKWDSRNLNILSSCKPVPVALLVASRYAVPGYRDRRVWVRGPGLAGSLCQVIAAYALRLNSRAGTKGSTVSSLICDRWLILGSETLEPLITDGLLLYALAGHQWFCWNAPLNWTLGHTVRGARELRPSIMQ